MLSPSGQLLLSLQHSSSNVKPWPDALSSDDVIDEGDHVTSLNRGEPLPSDMSDVSDGKIQSPDENGKNIACITEQKHLLLSQKNTELKFGIDQILKETKSKEKLGE